VLVYEDVDEGHRWLCRALGLPSGFRYVGRDGRIGHAQLSIAEGAIMLGRQGGTFCAPRSDEVNQYVIYTLKMLTGTSSTQKKSGSNFGTTHQQTVRGEAVYGRGPWWPPLDVFSKHSRCGSRGMGATTAQPA